MTLFELWIWFKGEDAVVAIVTWKAELAGEGLDGTSGVGVAKWFVEESGVYANVGTDVE